MFGRGIWLHACQFLCHAFSQGVAPTENFTFLGLSSVNNDFIEPWFHFFTSIFKFLCLSLDVRECTSWEDHESWKPLILCLLLELTDHSRDQCRLQLDTCLMVYFILIYLLINHIFKCQWRSRTLSSYNKNYDSIFKLYLLFIQ